MHGLPVVLGMKRDTSASWSNQPPVSAKGPLEVEGRSPAPPLYVQDCSIGVLLGGGMEERSRRLDEVGWGNQRALLDVDGTSGLGVFIAMDLLC